MAYVVHHPVHGYLSQATTRRVVRWTRARHEARVFERIPRSIPDGSLAQSFAPATVQDWRSIAVPFESVETELIGLPAGVFGEPCPSASTGTGVVGGDRE